MDVPSSAVHLDCTAFSNGQRFIKVRVWALRVVRAALVVVVSKILNTRNENSPESALRPQLAGMVGRNYRCIGEFIKI